MLLDAAALTTVVAEFYRQASSGFTPALALLIAGAVVVATRRRLPLTSAAAAVVLSAAALADPAAALSVWILAEVTLFSLPLRRSTFTTVIIATTHGIILYGGALVVYDVGFLDPLALILPLWTAATVVSGAAVRSHADYVEAIRTSAQSDVVAREARVLRRVEEERLSIARDLHDSVANSIAVMTISAASAGRNLERDPARAKRELEQVRLSGAHVLEEMTDILTLLRRDTSQADDEHDRTLPVVASIPALVSVMRVAGLTVTLDSPPLPDLAPAVDTALFRVAQEALTNAHKHGVSPVAVSLAAEADEVILGVRNRVANRGSVSPGFGLIGMRERVESAGGSLRVGASDGWFTVEARFPLSGHTSEAGS